MPLPDFQMFANRLAKMQRHLGKWARREGITCYRVYDADIPEFPLAVDRYDNCLHVAEYQRDHPLDEEEYRIWRSGCRQILADTLEVAHEDIYFKSRSRQKGTAQYEKQALLARELVVQEDGLNFKINLSDYLDTGLFLDHRPTRRMVRERSMGKSVLNLFAYTGAFTVHAAAGGANATTTIDMSATYLDWARHNLRLNELEDPNHRFLQADVTTWLRDSPEEDPYDLIVLDPPTFSNSKRMRYAFDIQTEYPYLINRCLQRLRPGGTLFFSTNFRKFRLDPDRIWGGARITDISEKTIPPDFRNKKIHYCFELFKEHA
ncbi:MAG: class I SAM-dependent methyltransferase [Saprospiraceae bacterium]|nr:class I SAM-dependent methyltransferase [Saprospiraceae bacterium]